MIYQSPHVPDREPNLLDQLVSEDDSMSKYMSLMSLLGGVGGAGGSGLPGLGGSFPTSGSGPGASSFAGGPIQLAQNIGRWIVNKPGFTVGGLENMFGTGQVSSGHIPNSQHYTGHAGDVSYVGGGKFPNETAALNWLYDKLDNRWGDRLTELLWQVENHYDHLHYGTRPGG